MMQTEMNGAQLAGLYQLMQKNGDTSSADKILQIYEKWRRQEFMISFAGHFSAGKSSMINHLLDRSLLPKSPIPTSANIVKIRSGEGKVRIYLNNGQLLEYEEPYNIDMVKAYATNKGVIKELEIDTPDTMLVNDAVVVDTPGIDAADDTDRMITESSLHLVDALFYVMDYNHVQSDVNLYFLKKVQDYKIPVYLIINQIDKHDEQELTFQTFTEKIKQTFDQWDINPREIYYTSLMDLHASYNQLTDVKQALQTMMASDWHKVDSVSQSVHLVVNEHKTFLQEAYASEESPGEATADESLANAEARLEELNAQINDLNQKPERMRQDFFDTLNNTLKNAYVMPAALRDRAQAFLESQQRDFKRGLFATKKKTEAEREQRTNTFLTELQQSIETSILWKVRDKWLRLLQEYDLHDQALTQQIQNLSLTYDADSLKQLIKPGAQVTGDYILHYTEDISSDVKQSFKQKAIRLWDDLYAKIADKTQQELSAYTPEQEQLEQICQKNRQEEQRQNTLQEKEEEVVNLLEDPQSAAYDPELLMRASAEKYKRASTSEQLSNLESPEAAATETDDRPVQEPVITGDHILDDLDKTIRTVSSLPGFQSLIEDLQQKRDRLKNRTYTIALFGAFSAGKSTFANALIGENILPSAPNPTTAAINRIQPVTSTCPHGTVVLHLKDEAALVNDLKAITSALKPQANDLHSLLTWIREQAVYQDEQLAKTQQAYLRAMLDGYQASQPYIGESLTTHLEEFADYVTDEKKACYLESVDLYYDCSLTREGITLVDTPGADSINARHTNVAFDYIKQADAILYVTYYNHPFSRADKHFLMQLGRVKDAFHLDKMFFIMNAADLAEDDSEQNMVQQYIKEQLTGLGIRMPRIFPVSSKQSLKDKMNNDALNQQMTAFEASFNQFIHNELTSLTVQAANRDIRRVKQAVDHYLHSAQMDATEKEQARADLLRKQESLKQATESMETAIYEQKISQKLQKQVYYILERLSIRFHDWFKDSFNPTTITESGSKAQTQLADNLMNLLDDVGYDLLQELRAVSLRIESLIRDMQQELFEHYKSQSSSIDEAFILPDAEPPELMTPEFQQAFLELESSDFAKELKQFNGTKAFFVKNEKETMMTELFNRLYPYAQNYIAVYEEKMRDAYLQQWSHILDESKQFIYQQIDSYIANQLQMIDDPSIDIKTLEQKHDALTTVQAEKEGET
ncbi:dynamin family protein [Barrientosiimonas marina]|uniref:Dynamin family protein n=1 Tax=Lentibacillus kimchii TaxID=1542911 RepID=A0ABW2UYW5_9BACI